MQTHQPEDALNTIATAFSLVAEKYDQFGDDHPHQTRMREKVYAHLMGCIPTGSHILELNCGSGTDAVYIAEHGYRVHATDIAPGMLERLAIKVKQHDLGKQITYQNCSFLTLDQVAGGPYDALFSNLGGLNCTDSLSAVTRQIPLVLKPSGVLVWVVMPPICLWELVMAFAGQFRYAFRRLPQGGTIAHLEGRYFPVYYYTPQQVVKALGSQFHILGVEGLSVITPTAESKNLAKDHPTFYKALAWLDDHLSPYWPWRGWGDFFILSARYQP